jgi:AcrR family transcriptional regulator
MPGGRPRAFDVDAALDSALEVFWRQGYEGAALSDLTAAMGINRPSLYATFGNKEALFGRVLERYLNGPGGFATAALDAPTARQVAERLLYGAVELTCGPRTPRGCLSVRCTQAGGPDSDPARQAVLAARKAGHLALVRRLERARAEGDLPAGSNPRELARLLATVSDGIAVQAAGGASPAELRRTAAAVLQMWPS